MLIVQMMSGTVETDRTNGSSQRRYQGYTTGAHKSDAAIGHANVCGEYPSCRLRGPPAVIKPTNAAKPATTRGLTIRSISAKTGSLKRNRSTNTLMDPIGIEPPRRNGTYSSPTMSTASNPSPTRTVRQESGANTIGRNFTATASPNVIAAKVRQRRSSAVAESSSSSTPRMPTGPLNTTHAHEGG